MADEFKFLKVPTRCATCGTFMHMVRDTYAHTCMAPVPFETAEASRNARNAATLANMRARRS